MTGQSHLKPKEAESKSMDSHYRFGVRPVEGALRLPGNSIKSVPEFSDDSIRKGVEAEQRTAGILSTLMSGTDGKVLHSIMVNGAYDIDHVFFCDRGVFVIDTKYRACTTDVGRKLRGYWGKRAREASDVVSQVIVFDQVPRTVFQPVIALWSEPTSLVNPDHHEQVALVPGELIADFILAGPAVMSVDAASAMFETLRLRINKTLAGVTK